MKYIWIVMLIILDIIWFIISLKDFIKTDRYFKFPFVFEALEEYTVAFILLHLSILFFYSLILFVEGLE